jgi:hypothetical protein
MANIWGFRTPSLGIFESTNSDLPSDTARTSVRSSRKATYSAANASSPLCPILPQIGQNSRAEHGLQAAPTQAIPMAQGDSGAAGVLHS